MNLRNGPEMKKAPEKKDQKKIFNIFEKIPIFSNNKKVNGLLQTYLHSSKY